MKSLSTCWYIFFFLWMQAVQMYTYNLKKNPFKTEMLTSVFIVINALAFGNVKAKSIKP